MSRQDQIIERENARKVLSSMLADGSRVACVLVRGRGESDYVECFAASHGQVERITYYVARAIDYHGNLERGIRKGGGQYNKTHDVVDDLSHALGLTLTHDRVLTV